MGSAAVGLTRRMAIEENLREERAFYILYNGSFEEVVVRAYNSVHYKLPPDGETLDKCEQDPKIAKTNLIEKRGEVNVFDGTLKVFDIYEAPKELWAAYRKSRKQGNLSVKPPTPTNLRTPCRAVAAHILAYTENQGVARLTGDPVQDKAIKKAARTRAIAWDTNRCEQIVGGYNDRAAAFRANPRNASQPVPRMSPLERKAQEKLDVYRAGMEMAESVDCPVQDCGYFTDAPKEQARKVMRLHITAQHGGDQEIMSRLEAQLSPAEPTDALVSVETPLPQEPAEEPKPEKRTRGKAVA